MKKVVILIILIILILVLNNYNAEAINFDIYKQNLYNLSFDNLNSKELNSLFQDSNCTIVSIKINNKHIKKEYIMNISLLNNIEQELTTKIINDINDKEIVIEYITRGYIIESIKMYATYNEITKLQNISKFDYYVLQ